MYITVNDTSLYFDVEGAGLVVRGSQTDDQIDRPADGVRQLVADGAAVRPFEDRPGFARRRDRFDVVAREQLRRPAGVLVALRVPPAFFRVGCRLRAVVLRDVVEHEALAVLGLARKPEERLELGVVEAVPFVAGVQPVLVADHGRPGHGADVRELLERDLRAIYEYLRAIPPAEPGTPPAGPRRSRG